jgi:hypothetical protein
LRIIATDGLVARIDRDQLVVNALGAQAADLSVRRLSVTGSLLRTQVYDYNHFLGIPATGHCLSLLTQ